MRLDTIDEPRREFLKRNTTVDVAACPGSGKTSLVVAKLAILARKWPHATKGICTLSHTNVAREQIEQYLGHTGIGQRLLSYPHFFGTIHGFANRFLGLPWLKSNGYPTPTIGNDITTAYRRRVLGNRKFENLTHFLKKKNLSVEELRILRRDLTFQVGDKPFPASSDTKSYRRAKRAVETTAKNGFFCFDEMFVWAEALLEDYQDFPIWLSQRFPLVILDEMQDTSSRQVSLLDKCFNRNSDLVVVQRVGDPNQGIFGTYDEGSDKTESYPYYSPERLLDIPNSFRFGAEIAAFATGFAVKPVGDSGLTGLGPKNLGVPLQERKHAVFVFPDDSTEGVLDCFGKLVLSVLGQRLAKKGLVSAVGYIHKDDPEVEPGNKKYPKSVGDYFSEYIIEGTTSDPHPQTLFQILRQAQTLASESRDLEPSVQKIAAGTIELARLLGDIGELKQKVRSHRTIVEALDDNPDALETYRNFLTKFLVQKTDLKKEDCPFYWNSVTDVAAALCNGETCKSKARFFLAWPTVNESPSKNGSLSSKDVGPNIHRVNDNGESVDIRIGSIHSVKGQTHLATLLLSTFWHAHSSVRMMPWLLGEKVNKAHAGKRDVRLLKLAYVAMTRPSHLLCLALPCAALGGRSKSVEIGAKLKERGWQVIRVAN